MLQAEREMKRKGKGEEKAKGERRKGERERKNTPSCLRNKFLFTLLVPAKGEMALYDYCETRAFHRFFQLTHERLSSMERSIDSEMRFRVNCSERTTNGLVLCRIRMITIGLRNSSTQS